MSADKLCSRPVPCLFLGFVPDAPGFTTPPRAMSSLLRTSLEPVKVAVEFGPARGTKRAKLERAEPGGGGGGGTKIGGAEPGGAETGGTEPRGAETGGAEPEGAETAGAEPGGPEPAGAAPGGALSSQQLREWYSRGATGAVGGATCTRTGGAQGAGAGGVDARCPAGGGADNAAGAGAIGGTRVGTTGAAGGAVGVGVAAGGSSAVSAGSGGTSRPRLYFVPLPQQILGHPPHPCPAPSVECPPPVQSQSQLQPASPLPGPCPYTGPTGGLTERSEPKSCHVSPVSRSASPVRAACTSRCVPRQRTPAVPCTHQMTLRPSTAPQRVPLPSPPASSLPALADPESDSLRAASSTVTRLLATAVTDPSFESAAPSALVAELVDFAAHYHLDYAASLVAKSDSLCPPSIGGECALGTDVLEERQEEFECFATAVPHLVSMLIAREGDPDAPDIPTPHSYAEAIVGE
ncbi:unnamed protein product [Closterium sp. NIES-65]|nr:unnamed protein product [Closterium sp. NIES-65]